MNTYTITYAGCYESILRTCREIEHETIEGALSALCRVVPGLESDTLVTEMVDGGRYVYRSQDEADEDVGGTDPVAVIEVAS